MSDLTSRERQLVFPVETLLRAIIPDDYRSSSFVLGSVFGGAFALALALAFGLSAAFGASSTSSERPRSYSIFPKFRTWAIFLTGRRKISSRETFVNG